MKTEGSASTPYEHLANLLIRNAELERRLGELADLTNADYDGPLFAAVWKMTDAAIDAVAEICGDEAEWITWYIMENKSGSNGLEATSGADMPLTPIRTTEDLARLLGIPVETRS